MSITNAFPVNFYNLRKKFGYTQAEIATKLDVAPQTIYKYEKGIAFPPGDKIQVILELFRVSPNELFCPEEKTPLDKLEWRVKEHVELMQSYKTFNFSHEKFAQFESPTDYLRFKNEECLDDIDKIIAEYLAEQIEVRKELDPILRKKANSELLEIEQQFYDEVSSEFYRENKERIDDMFRNELLDD